MTICRSLNSNREPGIAPCVGLNNEPLGNLLWLKS